MHYFLFIKRKYPPWGMKIALCAENARPQIFSSFSSQGLGYFLQLIIYSPAKGAYGIVVWNWMLAYKNTTRFHKQDAHQSIINNQLKFSFFSFFIKTHGFAGDPKMFGSYPIRLPFFYHSSPTLSGTLVGLWWDLSGT